MISFLDFYVKTQRNMKGLGVRELTKEEIVSLAGRMAEIASKYHLIIETCAEQTDLKELGIRHGSCIDKQLIEKITGAKLLGGKDKNQRKECGCMESVEIGAYHTCLNGCKYCYANFNEAYVKETVKLYRPDSSLLCGCVTSEDKITVRKMKSLKEIQGSFLV